MTRKQIRRTVSLSTYEKTYQSLYDLAAQVPGSTIHMVLGLCVERGLAGGPAVTAADVAARVARRGPAAQAQQPDKAAEAPAADDDARMARFLDALDNAADSDALAAALCGSEVRE